MRILAVHSYYRQRGGEDVVFEAEADLLESFGHRVIRLTRSNEAFADLASSDMVRRSVINREVARAVAEVVRREKVEVAHFHNTFPSITAGAIKAAHQAGAATVQTLHNFRLLCPKAVCFREGEPCVQCVDKSFATPALQHRCFHDSRSATMLVAMHSWWHRRRATYRRFLDRAIAPTEFVRSRYERSLYPMAPIRVKPHFVADRGWIGSGEGGYAVFVGRLSEEKGVKTLLDAWGRLQVPIPLRLIGSGPLAELIQEHARRSHSGGPDGRIEWLGWLPPEEVEQQIGEAALLCLPSACGESFGRVVIESLAQGTPVLCSDHGGQHELVHANFGGSFRNGDADDLARAVDDLTRRLRSGTPLRQSARAEYLSRYTAAANHRQLMTLYKEAIREREAKQAGHGEGDSAPRLSDQRGDFPVAPQFRLRRLPPPQAKSTADASERWLVLQTRIDTPNGGGVFFFPGGSGAATDEPPDASPSTEKNLSS